MRKGNDNDRDAIKKLMMTQEEESLEQRVFLNHILNVDRIHVADTKEDIQGFSQINPKILSLHGKNIKASYIVKSFNHGAAIEELLDRASTQEFITLVRTDTPEQFEPHGFETVIENFEYNINATSLPEFSVEGIVLDPSDEDLVRVYNQFTQHFTGFFQRDSAYFASLKKEMHLRNGGIVGLSQEGELVAYALYEAQGTSIAVRECCYSKSGQMVRLLSFVSRGKSRVLLTASIYEHMDRVLPDIKRIKRQFILARINDKDLFERLFHIKIISAYSGFNAFGKPLWNRDFY
ncbi:hypothetical protein G7062_00575 [Erysipelothrix sp. HDW6C]|uniref:hypothetical protein n=1 Tax=Erysipelothrix sp. HDW6C TaxID=2714930 RepID=UPI0014073498|nr:hypothetical protein [Erysipelothrix sp. HDW6C]QIK68868.1 hypothetical protein G7062_00575 [Erysipelothrix sp. HDW6C]